MAVTVSYGGRAGTLEDLKHGKKRAGLKSSAIRGNNKITAEAVRALAAVMCSIPEMAQYFGCSQRHLERTIQNDELLRKALREGRGRAKVTLRRRQVEQANNGNVQMLIWLGKNYLSQSDKLNVAQRDDLPEDETDTILMRWNQDLDRELEELDAEVNGG